MKGTARFADISPRGHEAFSMPTLAWQLPRFTTKRNINMGDCILAMIDHTRIDSFQSVSSMALDDLVSLAIDWSRTVVYSDTDSTFAPVRHLVLDGTILLDPNRSSQTSLSHSLLPYSSGNIVGMVLRIESMPLRCFAKGQDSNSALRSTPLLTVGTRVRSRYLQSQSSHLFDLELAVDARLVSSHSTLYRSASLCELDAQCRILSR